MAKEGKEKQTSKKSSSLIVVIIVLLGLIVGGYFLYTKTFLIQAIMGQKCQITFIVEGDEQVKEFSYGDKVSYGSTPTKAGSETVEYVFTGWQPELGYATGHATHIAQFTSQTRLYNVNAISNLNSACTITGGGKIYEYNESATLSVQTNIGYTFEGWYLNDEFYSNELTISFDHITEDFTLVARHSLIVKNITYVNTHDVDNENPTSYTIENGLFALLDLQDTGYKFLGWFTSLEGGEKVESVDSTELVDVTLYARWQVETYTISYNLKGASNHASNPVSYTYFSEDITIYPLTKEGVTFIGWTGSDLDGYKTQFVIASGSTGNREYTANFDGEEVTLTLNVDGKVLDELTLYSGDVLNEPQIEGSEYGMSGYQINKWYSDSNYQTAQTFGGVVREDLTIYSSWDWMFSKGFYPYIEKFSSATSGAFNINSFNELTLWAEYVKFYDITERIEFNLTYVNKSGYDLLYEIENAVELASFTGSDVNYSVSGSDGSIYIKDSTRAVEATKDADPSFDGTFAQQDYAFRLAPKNTRPQNYDDFNINKVSKTMNVSTSNQLVYALEKGCRPVCQTGSSAESIYNKAKAVLRKICSDDMSDIEKLAAIYEWLIFNVAYDNVAANSAFSLYFNWKEYDSWYAEGVFNKGKAVCDGIAKAFVILAKIENIPCLRIEGDAHAWNRAYVNSNWYGFDATHGGVQFTSDSSEALTYYQFMFTDAFKTAQGYTGTNYTEYAATTKFDYYSYYEVSNGVDLYVENVTQLAALLSKAKKAVGEYESTYYTVEVAIHDNLEKVMTTTISAAASAAGVNIQKYSDVGQNTAGNTVYMLFIKK